MRTQDRPQDETVFVCPRTGRLIASRPAGRWKTWLFPVSGLVCLAWFLVRVIPKPSRALYPCQRMAFPVASGFVAWLVGMATMIVAFRKAREFGKQRKALIAIACLAIAVAAGLHTLFSVPARPAVAGTDLPNSPIGVAKGVNPGRVVWVHNRGAVDQAFKGEYQGDGHWWEQRHNNQAAIDNTLSVSLRKLTNTNSDQAAWDAIFRYFNQTHGRGNVGYTAGEKINIMPNLVAQANQNDGRVNLTTWDQVSLLENVSVSPWLILSLLRQLVTKAGVPQDCISVGQSMCFFPNQYFTPCYSEFPNVVYLDNVGNAALHRTKFVYSNHNFYWSKPGVSPAKQDKIPQPNVDATYFIDIANLKTHQGGGISQCGKCYYGSLIRTPSTAGYYELHGDLPWSSGTSGLGHYRTLVDLMAHSDFGYGKGLLWIQDWMWGGTDAGTRPSKWTITPFSTSWPGSVVVSQDPVAIDSFGLDACKANKMIYVDPAQGNYVSAPDDYLHEAATIDDPPSGVFYDPDHPQSPPGNRVRRTSLGVHEHWNNDTDRKYSRNLGTGNGIELMWLEIGKTADINFDTYVNVVDLQLLVAAWASGTGDGGYNPDADLNKDGFVNVGDLQLLVLNWGL